MKGNNPVLKLTVSYTLVVLIISAFFSANLYRVSIQEIDSGFQRQANIINNSPRLRGISSEPDFIRIRQDSYADAKDKLLFNLFITNSLVLSLGALFSFWFAKKTLEPIEESHEAQSRFTADASHELRTPISVMKSEIEVALKAKNLKIEDAKEVLRSNLEEVDRMSSLINSLLQLAHMSDESIEVKSLDLGKVFTAAETKVSKTAAFKNIKLDVPRSESRVVGNYDLLVQAVVVIFDNAIKYSPEKSIITASIHNVGKLVHIDVEDEGPGIKAEEVSKVFKRFYRSDNSRSKQNVEGYGLGLSIAKSIMEKQKGKIEILKTNKKGTTFRLTLPRA